MRGRICAEKAEQENSQGMAKLFRAVAESEAIHARNKLWLLHALRDTDSNGWRGAMVH